MDEQITKFKKHLEKAELSGKTIDSYMWTLGYFFSNYEKLNKENILAYKGYLSGSFQPQTVNLRLQAINKYLEFIDNPRLKVKFVKVQQKSFLENVISLADYDFLKTSLKKDNNDDWYFVVWFLGATGARISEFVKIKANHVKQGHLDLYTKGGKNRRIYIPKKLREEAIKWIQKREAKDKIPVGYLFVNRFGKRITERGVAQQLKHFARKYEIDDKLVYPHSFRHMYGKNFIEKFKDIALLADLMGHESIETTRIYLRRTATEQQDIVDKIITW